MSKAEDDAAALISTIEHSFKAGYTFYTMKHVPLITVTQVIDALVTDQQIIINEPNDQYNYTFHKGEVR